MHRKEMDLLVEARLAAEVAGDAARCVAVYTHDVEHDLVGAPLGPLRGREKVRALHERRAQDLRAEEIVPVRAYYGDDFCVLEHEWTGTVPGSLLGAEGGGGRVSFRVLCVWEFRDGLISRESVWLDAAGALAQLAAPEPAAAAAPRRVHR
ncbi:MAG TPA: nuclear transport factor 2 family protein [Gaiellaceae bacterium]|nr:nuclear transport factor 2 family protein [Gaiellaceae bacterium]